MIRKEELNLTTEWDKTFPRSEKVDHSKVTFVNRYGITLAADLYELGEYFVQLFLPIGAKICATLSTVRLTSAAAAKGIV